MKCALGFVLSLVVVVLMTVFVMSKIYEKDYDHELASYTYYGQLSIPNSTYKVVIDEVDHGYGLNRMIHLTPAGGPSYAGITGHDYNSDGKWDRIFYGGGHPLVEKAAGVSEVFGYNSVTRTKKGWKFEPCPADKGKVLPFSNQAIEFAITTLNDAMRGTHNQDHLDTHWRWDERQQQVVCVIDHSS